MGCGLTLLKTDKKMRMLSSPYAFAIFSILLMPIFTSLLMSREQIRCFFLVSYPLTICMVSSTSSTLRQSIYAALLATVL